MMIQEGGPSEYPTSEYVTSEYATGEQRDRGRLARSSVCRDHHLVPDVADVLRPIRT
jgi:hypothetical protein